MTPHTSDSWQSQVGWAPPTICLMLIAPVIGRI